MRNSVRGLTTRQRQIMELVVGGQPSKNIAADLGISRRTVENHRASIMRKNRLNIHTGVGAFIDRHRGGRREEAVALSRFRAFSTQHRIRERKCPE